MILTIVEIFSKACEDSLESFPPAVLSSRRSPEQILQLLSSSPFSQLKAKALQKINKTFFRGSNDLICSFIARQAIDSANHSVAQTFSLVSSDTDLAIELLDKWAAEAPPQEKCWFVTRYILLKLAGEKPAEAKLIFAHYSSNNLFAGSPASILGKYIQYLIKAIDLESAEIFRASDEKFIVVLEKDHDLKDLADKIGHVYFGIVKQRPLNMMDMMSRMMGM